MNNSANTVEQVNSMMEMDDQVAEVMPEPGRSNHSVRERIQKVVFLIFKGAAAINGLALLIICGFVLYYGLPAISWEFLTESPRNSMTEGGILPCIVGTVVLSYGALMIALPWGIATAVYLNEYATSHRLVRIIRLGINTLAGVPSVVFGLFGLSLFVTVMGMGVSIMAGICTLGALALPLVIGASEEALRSVPQTYREASLGLGATKWQTIYKVVLPAALPGMLTGAILTLSRAAGETAAIMFTAAVFFSPEMPQSLFDDVMALPYHIYVLATAGTEIEKTRHIQYGTSLVLISLVLGMNMIAIYIRARMQNRAGR
ncbi:phosphate ABC transporter permease PstA [Maridesulfovibrio hydrothermalis]|uniref:Phosphate transport system permease protein PstA n=1 Tax=Maridesulfovibrio hydrothermalis AM13 = DSM 14728 TaxID=1121451 RepID=L0RCM8_9BACT|nr:Phosphate ABC transporter, inner membrane subunit PstA [Maridesulfovibrio hydrothermalis AM13 = DSM 14728]